jgi:hypothetical protein
VISLSEHLLVGLILSLALTAVGQIIVRVVHRRSLLSAYNVYLLVAFAVVMVVAGVGSHKSTVTDAGVVLLLVTAAMALTATRRRAHALGAGGPSSRHRVAIARFRTPRLQDVPRRADEGIRQRQPSQAHSSASNKHHHGGGAWNFESIGERSSPGSRDDPASNSVNVDAGGGLRDTVIRSWAGGCLSTAGVAVAVVVASALPDDELGGGCAARREAELAPGQALAEPNELRYLLARVADNLNQPAHVSSSPAARRTPSELRAPWQHPSR